MKILVLDDDLNRLSMFRRKFIGHEVTCVETAHEAIRELKENEFFQVYLDHDLGGQVFASSGPGTGYEVAQFLEQHPERKPKAIFIHSFNPSGAANMGRALPEAHIVPGIWAKAEPQNPMGAEEYS